MHRRHYLITTGGIATTLVLGSATAGEHETNANEDDDLEFLTEDDETTPQEFMGDSSEVIEDITIDGGLTVVKAAYVGPDMSNFIVELIPEDGEFDELFQNELEPYEGERGAVLDADTYLLDVEADGEWEIEIYQPRAEEGDSLPQEFEDETDRVYGPFEFDSNHIATGSHSGEGNFIVDILPMDEGEYDELVFNEIGQVEGNETTFRFDDIGWVAVQADGDWALEIE